ncbi:hypothetical protein H5410_031489 [Solanum commersonii]|uniref:Uncharacterized protein n=1 Tax=Solanum commersonii TaxID=4109 RepID=A0A9J5YK26_SOLCO|nr:hypothetical protein H5410_031489 [Solanum commersonii]
MPTYMMSLFPMPMNTGMLSRNWMQSEGIFSEIVRTGRFTYLLSKWSWKICNCGTISMERNYYNKARKTLFWDDIWSGQHSLKSQFPDLHFLSQQKNFTVMETSWEDSLLNLFITVSRAPIHKAGVGLEDDIESQNPTQGSMLHIVIGKTSCLNSRYAY